MSEHIWLEQAAPYALGALDPDDRASFDAHLVACELCSREVSELRQVAGLLALASPAVAPPPSLRDRILDHARAVRPIRSATPVTGPGSREPERTSTRRASAAHARAIVPWLAAAAAIVLAVALGGRVRAEQTARVAAERALASAQRTLDSAGAALARRDSVIATLVAPDVQAVNVTSAGPNPSARYYLDRHAARIVIAASSLPPAARGRTYQLWGIATGKPPVSLGTFDADSGGRALVSLPVPTGLDIAATAVTDEPAGGSPQPTTTPFLAATW